MSNRTSLFLILYCLTVSPLCFSSAGSPLITDDPATPGPGKWEVNIAITTEKNSNETHLETPLIDLNYGIGEKTELKYEIPFVISDIDGESTKTGFDRSSAGIKYRFLEKEKTGISASFYPQITFASPVGSHLKNENSDDSKEYLFPLELEEEAKGFEFNQEIGFKSIQNEKDQLVYGLATSYSLRESLELLGELHGASTTDLKDSELIINVGTALELDKAHAILVSVGKSLREFESAPKRVLAYLGIQFKF